MLFKDLIKGSLVYFIENNSKLSLYKGIVSSISQPRFDIQNNNGHSINQQYSNKIIDLMVDIDNRNMSFTIKEDSNGIVFTTTNSILFSDKESLIKELNVLKNSFESIINESKNISLKLDECYHLLGEYDTEYKQKKEIEARLNNIETQFSDMNNKLNQILNNLNNGKG